MVSSVFNLYYLNQNFIKLSMYGMFWNSLDEQNPKMSLGVPFDQVCMEKTQKTSCCKLREIVGTGASSRHSHCCWEVLSSQEPFNFRTSHYVMLWFLMKDIFLFLVRTLSLSSPEGVQSKVK